MGQQYCFLSKRTEITSFLACLSRIFPIVSLSQGYVYQKEARGSNISEQNHQLPWLYKAHIKAPKRGCTHQNEAESLGILLRNIDF